MDTSAFSHLNSNVNNLSIVFNSCLYPSVRVGDGKTIPVTNTGHSILSTLQRPLHLHNVLVTPNIIKNLISVRQFTRDNNCTIEFDTFGFSIKDFLTRHILLTCDSSGDLYPVTKLSSLPSALMSLSPSTWHQRLGHPGDGVLRSLSSRNFISCNKEKSPHVCHACQFGKHVKLPFSSSTSIVSSYFEIIRSDIWTSPIVSTGGFKYYVIFLDQLLIICGFILFWLNLKFLLSLYTFVLMFKINLDVTLVVFNMIMVVLILRPSGDNIVRCLWLVQHKFHADGSLSRYKARLVANGSSQQLGIDCDETFSPVVKPATIQTILSLALTRHWPIHQLDVKNAFLNGDLSLYGLKQAPRAWFHRFAAYATRVGFSHSRCDSSLFIYRCDREFDMTDLGALNHFLGISVTRDTIGMFLSQKRYVMELLERAHMFNLNPTRTPVDTESKLGPEGTPISDPTLYRSLAGGLQYLTFTRLDLSYAVQPICLYMNDPREAHLATLKRILRYIRGTLEFGLQLYASSESSLVAYSEADWAGCPATRRSTFGAEAEYRGVANVVAATTWLHNLLRELHTPLLTATLVYYDNVSVVYLSVNPVQHQRTKHIEIDIHFVRDMVAMGHVRVLHVTSRYCGRPGGSQVLDEGVCCKRSWDALREIEEKGYLGVDVMKRTYEKMEQLMDNEISFPSVPRKFFEGHVRAFLQKLRTRHKGEAKGVMDTVSGILRIDEVEGPSLKGRVTHPRIQASKPKEILEKEETQIQEEQLPKEKHPKKAEPSTPPRRNVALKEGNERKDEPAETPRENKPSEKVAINDPQTNKLPSKETCPRDFKRS
ncbi:ribonuclease H-like domain-containing protein [Tanacetum coccineum]